MDWLDYREKLGIGFCDDEKFSYFRIKIFNYLDGFADAEPYIHIKSNEYMRFCNRTGSRIDTRLFDTYSGRERYQVCVDIIRRHAKSLSDFLAYYIAFVNSFDFDTAVPDDIDFLQLLQCRLEESHIPYEVYKDTDGIFIFPKGAEELDKALVSQPLAWLSSYPKTHTAFVKALKDYANAEEDRASEAADKFRKALETFMHEFFNTEKSLENCKPLYGDYLKKRGIPKEISGNLETLLLSYTNFINGYAKHQDRTGMNVLEYIMYQTGNIIRLLITLKQGEKETAH